MLSRREAVEYCPLGSDCGHCERIDARFSNVEIFYKPTKQTAGKSLQISAKAHFSSVQIFNKTNSWQKS